MEHLHMDPTRRREITVPVSEELAEAANSLGLDLARIIDQALAIEVEQEKARQWKAENRDAIVAWNIWMEKNGLPLERYRMF